MSYRNGTLSLAAHCLTAMILVAGCASDSYTAKGVKQGAATGAAAGAIGGMISALVFGGDVVEAGARGAVYGGATGAVAGGISGSRADKAAAAQQQAAQEAELQQLKRSIGPDAYNGIEALADCKHDVAIANARQAGKSSNTDYALAGLWVEALAEADRRNQAGSRDLLTEIVDRDNDVSSRADAELAVDEALQELTGIREEYGMAGVCPG